LLSVIGVAVPQDRRFLAEWLHTIPYLRVWIEAEVGLLPCFRLPHWVYRDRLKMPVRSADGK